MRDLPFLASVETFFTLITMEIEWTLFSLRLSSLLLCVCLRFAFSYMHSHFISRFVFVYSSIHSFVFFEFSPPICARSTPIWQHLLLYVATHTQRIFLFVPHFVCIIVDIVHYKIYAFGGADFWTVHIFFLRSLTHFLALISFPSFHSLVFFSCILFFRFNSRLNDCLRACYDYNVIILGVFMHCC